MKTSVSKSKEVNIIIKEREEIIKEICKIEGGWLDYLEFNEEEYQIN